MAPIEVLYLGALLLALPEAAHACGSLRIGAASSVHPGRVLELSPKISNLRCIPWPCAPSSSAPMSPPADDPTTRPRTTRAPPDHAPPDHAPPEHHPNTTT